MISDIEGYGHRLGPKKQQVTNEALPCRPRPIIFRMRSRSSQIKLISTLSKKLQPQGSPYLSNHLTPSQIEDIKIKHRSGHERNPRTNIHRLAKKARTNDQDINEH